MSERELLEEVTFSPGIEVSGPGPAKSRRTSRAFGRTPHNLEIWAEKGRIYLFDPDAVAGPNEPPVVWTNEAHVLRAVPLNKDAEAARQKKRAEKAKAANAAK